MQALQNGPIPPVCTAAIPCVTGCRTRKEYRSMSDAERETFHKALKKMQANMIGDVSEYGLFVKIHNKLQSPAAHGGSAFLPWHRVFLFR